MKKLICLALCAFMLLAAAACSAKEPAAGAEDAPSPSPSETAAAEWTRAGFFQDENGHMLSVTWMEDVIDPGWYVGCLLGEDGMEDAWGGTLTPEGNALRGSLPSASGEKEALNVTLTEEGEDGLLLAVDGGDK